MPRCGHHALYGKPKDDANAHEMIRVALGLHRPSDCLSDCFYAPQNMV